MFEDLSFADLLDYDVYQHENEDNFEEIVDNFDFLIGLGNEANYKEYRAELLKETKEKKQKDSNAIDYDALFNEMIDGIIEEYNLPLWTELAETDKERENFFLFIANRGLKYFWGSQPRVDFQAKLVAATMAINSACTPPLTSKWRKEVQLPIINITGVSRSGKSYLGMLYTIPHKPENYRIILPDSTGATIREDVHNVCYRDDMFISSVVIYDNFRKAYLDKLGSFAVAFLKVLKSQAHSSKFDKGISSVFWCHCLKVVTTTESIADFTVEWKELELRMLSIFSARVEDFNSIGSFRFDNVPEQYEILWSKDNYQKFIHDYLYPLIIRPVDKFPFPAELQAQSLLTMATGCHVGVWSCIEEAIEYFDEYWKFVETRKGTKSSELLLIVDDFLEEHIKNLIDLYGAFTKDLLYDEKTKECASMFTMTQLSLHIKSRRSTGTINGYETNSITAYLGSVGWQLVGTRSGVVVTKLWD